MPNEKSELRAFLDEQVVRLHYEAHVLETTAKKELAQGDHLTATQDREVARVIRHAADSLSAANNLLNLFQEDK